MTKIKIFKKMMTTAKANGYNGSGYEYNLGYIVDGENINVLIFDKEFTNALWGEAEAYHKRNDLCNCEDKWKYLLKNVI